MELVLNASRSLVVIRCITLLFSSELISGEPRCLCLQLCHSVVCQQIRQAAESVLVVFAIWLQRFCINENTCGLTVDHQIQRHETSGVCRTAVHNFHTSNRADRRLAREQTLTGDHFMAGSANEVVFENPQHDFPQRIIYTLKDGGRLTAAIEGTKNGKTRRVDLNYQPTR